MDSDLKNLQQKLKVTFTNITLLEQALVHRSFLNENSKHSESNERLEFLGDAVLSFVISEWLYHKFPRFPEGKLTNLRSLLVKTDTLAIIGMEIGLGQYLLMSHGEKGSGGQNNPSLIANTVESIIGAIYLDQGIPQTRDFITNHFKNTLNKIINKGELKDAKSLLQERFQAQHQSATYKTLKEEGPDHHKIFTIGVFLKHRQIAVATGKSKQAAQEAAAKLALEKIVPKK